MYAASIPESTAPCVRLSVLLISRVAALSGVDCLGFEPTKPFSGWRNLAMAMAGPSQALVRSPSLLISSVLYVWAVHGILHVCWLTLPRLTHLGSGRPHGGPLHEDPRPLRAPRQARRMTCFVFRSPSVWMCLLLGLSFVDENIEVFCLLDARITGMYIGYANVTNCAAFLFPEPHQQPERAPKAPPLCSARARVHTAKPTHKLSQPWWTSASRADLVCAAPLVGCT